MENNLTVSELEILIQAMELLEKFSYVKTMDEINKIKDQVKGQKMKQEEKLKLKKELLGSAFNNFGKG